MGSPDWLLYVRHPPFEGSWTCRSELRTPQQLSPGGERRRPSPWKEQKRAMVHQTIIGTILKAAVGNTSERRGGGAHSQHLELN